MKIIFPLLPGVCVKSHVKEKVLGDFLGSYKFLFGSVLNRGGRNYAENRINILKRDTTV